MRGNETTTWLIRFINTAETFRSESHFDFNSYSICDNIDLDTILMEFESFYFVKFNKYPKISKQRESLQISSSNNIVFR